MNVLRRLTLAIALAVWVATPVVNGMGEGGGGTGVWVLPRAGHFSSAVTPIPGTSPRATLASKSGRVRWPKPRGLLSPLRPLLLLSPRRPRRRPHPQLRQLRKRPLPPRPPSRSKPLHLSLTKGPLKRPFLLP